jgi:hypothetical protein
VRTEGRERVRCGSIRVAVRLTNTCPGGFRPFVLIAGTVITLILVVVGSVALLFGVGNQPLPGVLTSSAPGMSVKE